MTCFLGALVLSESIAVVGVSGSLRDRRLQSGGVVVDGLQHDDFNFCSVVVGNGKVLTRASTRDLLVPNCVMAPFSELT